MSVHADTPPASPQPTSPSSPPAPPTATPTQSDQPLHHPIPSRPTRPRSCGILMTGNSSPGLRLSRRLLMSFRYGMTGGPGRRQRGVTSARTRAQSLGYTGLRRTRRFRVSPCPSTSSWFFSSFHVLLSWLFSGSWYPTCLSRNLPTYNIPVSPFLPIFRPSTGSRRCRVCRFIRGNDRRARGQPHHLEGVHLAPRPTHGSHPSSCSSAQANTTLQADGHARSVPAPWRTSPRRLLPSSRRCSSR